MIGNVTRTQIDLRARDIATRMRAVMRDATVFQALIAASLTELTGTDFYPDVGGDPSPDLANITGMADQYAQLAAVFAGQATVTTPTSFDDYGRHIPDLWPDIRNAY